MEKAQANHHVQEQRVKQEADIKHRNADQSEQDRIVVAHQQLLGKQQVYIKVQDPAALHVSHNLNNPLTAPTLTAENLNTLDVDDSLAEWIAYGTGHSQ